MEFDTESVNFDFQIKDTNGGNIARYINNKRITDAIIYTFNQSRRMFSFFQICNCAVTAFYSFLLYTSEFRDF